MKTILLVEDNPADEKLALRAFKKCGIVEGIVVARDGVEALDWLFCTGKYSERDSQQIPALILLDLNLPFIDGLEVLRRIRADERTRILPVVMLTSSGEEQDIVGSLAKGANAYVRKSVDFAHFTEAVQSIASFWLAINQPPFREPNV